MKLKVLLSVINVEMPTKGKRIEIENMWSQQ